MKKEQTEISPDLTIPGFDVTVEDEHSCQVRSQDGRYEFSAKIHKDRFGPYFLMISGNMLRNTYKVWLGPWSWRGLEFTTDADDVITQIANSLKLMDQLSSEGFSAKIDDGDLVLSHPSKPDYQLRMVLADARKIVPLKNTSLYTRVEYRGPAYNKEANTKWQLDGIDNGRLIVTNKGLEELAQEIKTRILSLGEEKNPRITQWVSEEIEKELCSQGFTFTSKPEECSVEFSHPTGLSGSLAFAPFTVGYEFDFNSKYPNPQFPTDIEREKAVLFTLDRRKYRKPYTKGFSAKEPQKVIDEFRQCLVISLLHREVCHAWKSDILVPKLQGKRLQFVNTKMEGDDSIILELTVEKDEVKLKGSRKTYKISDDPGEIAQAIADLAEKHVQEFIQANGIKLTNTRVVEIDF
jgi:hypothetical protein